ncbi:hypothetical protein DBR06_SOUSAS10610007, partial [Sousa chinensis]
IWLHFRELINQVMVTNNSRRMFPVLKLSMSGRDPNTMCCFILDFVTESNHFWKCVNREWVPGG